MKIKRFAIFLGTLVLIFTLFTMAFAEPVSGVATDKDQITIKKNENKEKDIKEKDIEEDKEKCIPEKKVPGKFGQKPELTDDMREKIDKIKEKKQEQVKKWNSLTEAQKAEIYKLQDEIAELSKKMADKYSEFGIIDKDTAKRIKEKVDELNSKIKSEGLMPMLDGGKVFRKHKNK
jgi:predicted transcriptional regulator